MEGHRNSDEIRADIERTRADMDETVQEIGYRLSPGQVVDRLWGRMRSGDAADSFVDMVREHPVPSVLIGLGLGWLVYERTSQTEGERLRHKYGDIEPGTYQRAEGRVGPYRGEDYGFEHDGGEGMGERVKSAALRAKDTATSAVGSVKDTASTVRDSMSSAADNVRDTLHDARDSARDIGERASERMEHMRMRAGEMRDSASMRASEFSHQARSRATHAWDEQPLVMAALSFGLGLASGLAVPSTRYEDRVVGDRADRFKDEVKRTGSEALHGAKRVAEEAQHAARDAVSREGVIDDLKDKAKSVAHEAKEAARHAMEREHLGDTLRHRAKGVAEQTREAAREAAHREGLDREGLKDRVRDSTDRLRE